MWFLKGWREAHSSNLATRIVTCVRLPTRLRVSDITVHLLHEQKKQHFKLLAVISLSMLLLDELELLCRFPSVVRFSFVQNSDLACFVG